MIITPIPESLWQTMPTEQLQRWSDTYAELIAAKSSDEVKHELTETWADALKQITDELKRREA